MNPFDFPPIAAVLSAAETALLALGAVTTAAGAVVIVTLAVRALLIPVGVSLVGPAAPDMQLLALGAALQEELGVPEPPPL